MVVSFVVSIHSYVRSFLIFFQFCFSNVHTLQFYTLTFIEKKMFTLCWCEYLDEPKAITTRSVLYQEDDAVAAYVKVGWINSNDSLIFCLSCLNFFVRSLLIVQSCFSNVLILNF